MQNTILFVDDDKDILLALERRFYEEGYTLKFATSGQEALNKLSETPCKVIVADIKMPKMNGFELLSKVRELYPDVIRIVLSGHDDVQFVLENVNKEGIDHYLTKPWNIEDVKNKLKQSIELFDLRREVAELRRRLNEKKDF